MQAADDVLKPAAVDLCRYIDQKTFSDAIVSLGLLSESDLLQRNDDDGDDDVDDDHDDHDGDDHDHDGDGIAVVSEISSITSSSSLSVLSSRSNTIVCYLCC